MNADIALAFVAGVIVGAAALVAVAVWIKRDEQRRNQP